VRRARNAVTDPAKAGCSAIPRAVNRPLAHQVRNAATRPAGLAKCASKTMQAVLVQPVELNIRPAVRPVLAAGAVSVATAIQGSSPLTEERLRFAERPVHNAAPIRPLAAKTPCAPALSTVPKVDTAVARRRLRVAPMMVQPAALDTRAAGHGLVVITPLTSASPAAGSTRTAA
jgi:hypothetical protein